MNSGTRFPLRAASFQCGGRLIRAWRIPFSIHCERVALASGPKGIAVDWIDVDADDRPAELEISGQTRVPVVEMNSEIVLDSLAIIERHEQTAIEPALWPADERGRVQVDLFLERVSTRLDARGRDDQHRTRE